MNNIWELLRIVILILYKIIEYLITPLITNIIDLSSFLAAMGSLFAAYMAYRAVNEMKKQRKTTVKPDLSIRGLKHFVYWYPNAEGIPIDWSRKKLSSKPSFQDQVLFNFSRFSFAEMECINIGNGVAKNIKINWEFDIDSLVKPLNKYDHHDLIDKLENADNYGVTINSKKLNFNHLYLNEEETIDFLLPFNQEEDKVTFFLSQAYIFLISLKIFLQEYNLSESEESDGFFRTEIPPLKVILQYEDINEEKFTKKFKVKIRIDELRFPKKGIKKWQLATEQIHFEVDRIEEN